jgi:hypothetical protein
MITTVDNYMDVTNTSKEDDIIHRKEYEEHVKKEKESETKKLLDYLLVSSLSLTIALAFNDMMLNIVDKFTLRRNEITVQFFYIIFMVIISIILAKYVL